MGMSEPEKLEHRIAMLERLVDDLREAGDALDRQSEVPTVAHNRWRKVSNEAVVALGGMVSGGAR
jgi:hypothetical protein